MILDALVIAVTTLMTGFLGLFPAFEFDSEMLSAGSGLGGAISGLNGIVPIVAIGQCILIVLACRLALAGWDLIVFIYDRFPGKFT